MSPWFVALAVSTALAVLVPPRFRRRAFHRGWFERSGETDRPRSRRRPTHGGIAAALAVAAGSLVAGVGEPATRAALGGSAIALLVTRWGDRRRGPAWLVPLSRVVSAAVVPLAGVRADFTGTEAVDAVLLGALALLVIGGLAVLEPTDGATPAVTSAAAVGLLVVAIGVDDPAAPV